MLGIWLLARHYFDIVHWFVGDIVFFFIFFPCPELKTLQSPKEKMEWNENNHAGGCEK